MIIDISVSGLRTDLFKVLRRARLFNLPSLCDVLEDSGLSLDQLDVAVKGAIEDLLPDMCDFDMHVLEKMKILQNIVSVRRDQRNRPNIPCKEVHVQKPLSERDHSQRPSWMSSEPRKKLSGPSRVVRDKQC